MYLGRWSERFDGVSLITSLNEFNSHTAYVKLDFSRYHDLMHWPFTSYCRAQYPRGWRSGFYHLRFAWRFRRREQILAPFHKLFLCPFGKHRIVVWYAVTSDEIAVKPVCKFCSYTRLPSESDIDNIPKFVLDRFDSGFFDSSGE